MTPRLARLALVMFLTLSGALVLNMLTLQHGERRTAAAPPKPPFVQMMSTQVADIAVDEDSSSSPKNGAASSVASSHKSKYQTVLAIQEQLTRRGYKPGPQDGAIGLMTRAAIMAYEHDYGLSLSGQATPDLRQRLETNAPKISSDSNRKKGWPATPEARRVIETVQVSLQRLGYSIRIADGVVGAESRRAIVKFESDQDFAQTGRISGRLIAKLVKLADQGRLASRQ